MENKVEIKNVEAMRVAYAKYRGEVKKANKIFPRVFKSIRGNSNGAPFYLYHSMNIETGEAELDLCVPTEAEVEFNDIEVKVMPSIKALSITHIGSYDTLHRAYEAIQLYASKNNIKIKPPYREVYIKGPGMIFKGNPNNYVTEILFPIMEQ